MILPLKKVDNTLYFVSNKFDDQRLESIEEKLQSPCHLQLIDSEKYELLEKQFSTASKNESNKIVLSTELSEDQKLGKKNPYYNLLGDCLNEAVTSVASDIHIEPKEDSIGIKLRRNGELHTWKELDLSHRDILISSAKSLFNLDLSVVGKPQDGRASFKSLKVDLRVNSLPTIYGEKIVLRLLDQSRTFNLSEITFPQSTHNTLNSILTRKNGLILISGPTGSGKTTTLYSMINSIDTLKLNVSTLEHPVEYRLSGINQIDVGSNKDLTFSSGLRALMRQDPDVILIGEIRDNETADMAFKAASTGHLVFSTVHANGSKEVIERLLNLGVDEFTLKSNLIFSSAQRLLKKLCEHCSIAVKPNELPNDLNKKNGYRKRNSDGCDNCEAGVSGRIPVLEFMTEKNIKSFIADKFNSDLDLNSLRNFAMKLAADGKVDVFEALEIE